MEGCEEEEGGVECEIAVLKRLMSSSSSVGEIGMGEGWGGRIAGARKKRIGRERRREKVRRYGFENIEFDIRVIILQCGSCNTLGEE